MTYNVLMGTLNPTHSLTHWQMHSEDLGYITLTYHRIRNWWLAEGVCTSKTKLQLQFDFYSTAVRRWIAVEWASNRVEWESNGV